jgi:hypothetical protein
MEKPPLARSGAMPDARQTGTRAFEWLGQLSHGDATC